MKRIVIFISIIAAFSACQKSANNTNNNSNSSIVNGTSKAGSLARFTTVNNYLYTLDNTKLLVFEIGVNAKITKVNTIELGQVSETLYPFRDKLYIASNFGMAVYSLSNPANPEREGYVQHVTGCDPVIANGNLACLTIHGGTVCNNNLNLLQIYDISNSEFNPTLLSNTEMGSPLGLGFLNDNTIAVCDRKNGLTIFDISKPNAPSKKQELPVEEYLDVIPYGNNMVAMLVDGLAYLDITDVNNVKQVSTLK